MLNPDAFTIQPEALSAPQALALWQSLIDDLDTLPELQSAEPMGSGPVSDMAWRLERAILAYAPATLGEAHALLTVADHVGRGLEIDPTDATDTLVNARRRAMAFLARLATDMEGTGHGH